MINEIHNANGRLLDTGSGGKKLNKAEFVALGMELGRVNEQAEAMFQNDLTIDRKEGRILSTRMEQYDATYEKFMGGDYSPTVQPANERERVRAAGLGALYEDIGRTDFSPMGVYDQKYQVLKRLEGTTHKEVAGAAVEAGVYLTLPPAPGAR